MLDMVIAAEIGIIIGLLFSIVADLNKRKK